MQFCALNYGTIRLRISSREFSNRIQDSNTGYRLNAMGYHRMSSGSYMLSFRVKIKTNQMIFAHAQAQLLYS